MENVQMETPVHWMRMNVSIPIERVDRLPRHSSNPSNLTVERRQCFVVHVFTDIVRILVAFF